MQLSLTVSLCHYRYWKQQAPPPFRGLHSPEEENTVKLSLPVISGNRLFHGTKQRSLVFAKPISGRPVLEEMPGYAQNRTSEQGDLRCGRDAVDTLIPWLITGRHHPRLVPLLDPKSARSWWRQSCSPCTALHPGPRSSRPSVGRCYSGTAPAASPAAVS